MIWDKEHESMPRANLQALQLQRLQAQVATVYEKVPFYRQALMERGLTPSAIRTLDDLTKLPFTIKRDFRDNYPLGLAAVPQEHIVRLETKPPNVDGGGAVPIRHLVKNTLRMRPDRIVVGEVRGGEALDMLQAMNTGHDGSLTTLHANSPRDALSRLETLVLMAGIDMPLKVIREQVASAVDLIVHQSRLKDGTRKITAISEVAGMEGDTIVMSDIFRFDQVGVSADGKVLGELKPTGIRPSFTPHLEASGFKLGHEVFNAEIGKLMESRKQQGRGKISQRR